MIQPWIEYTCPLGDINNDDFFAHGAIDDLDSREDSVDWENTGPVKRRQCPAECPGSEISNNNPAASMPHLGERSVLQPRGGSISSAGSSDSQAGYLSQRTPQGISS